MEKKNCTKKFTDISLKKNILIIISLGLIFIYFLPYLVLGEDFPVTILDNLDSTNVWFKFIVDSGLYFSPNTTIISQVMNGIPLSSVIGSISFSLGWYYLFGSFWGLVINRLLISLFGFVGMYLVLSKHFIHGNKNMLVQFGVATAFAVLPFYPFGLSVSGLPLLFYAFLNIRLRNTHYSNWLIIGFFPFYSSLILSGIFFMLIIAMLAIYDTLKNKKINYFIFLGLILLTVMYIISHWRLFSTLFLNSEYISHRTEILYDTYGIGTAIHEAKEIFMNHHYHVNSVQKYVLIPVIFALLFIWKDKEKRTRYLLILFFIILTSLFYGFLNWIEFRPIRDLFMSIIPIQLQRFHYLHPMFWYILLGMSLVTISSRLRIGKYLAIAFIIFQIGYIFQQHELRINNSLPTFRQFFAEEQFTEIKRYIGQSPSTFRVISVGLYPSIAQYNGFYTLDSYNTNYPLSYKHQFRRIIENELEKNETIKRYFDTWGSRCYAFSAELGLDYFQTKNSDYVIKHLDFNTDQFKEMGGRFIISSVRIDSANNSHYILKKEFFNDKSFWKIYLYEIL